MSKESKLVKNTIIYACGNMSSKVLAYVMVMIYSHYISPSELGYYDLVMTTVSLFLPIITFEIHEGVYRLIIGMSQYSRDEIIGTSIRFLAVSTSLSAIILIAFSYFINIRLLPLIMFYLISNVFYGYLQIVVRGCSENKFYALLGVLNSIITLVSEFIAVVLLKKGIAALFFSLGLANAICILLILFKFNFITKAFTIRFNRMLLKELLYFSIPLIPTTICWWVVNACDRYIIMYGLGTEYNGIYAISTKFPTIVTTISSVFYLAWQESALKEYDSEHRDAFFSDVFHKYHRILISVCMCGIPAVRVVIELFMSSSYSQAWKFTGPLFLSTVYMALSSFLGLGYQISKETGLSTVTSVIAAIVNVAINVIFIKPLGLYAASISTLLSYFIMFVIRVKQTKKYFTIDYRVTDLVVGPVFCVLLMVTVFLTESIKMVIVESIICVLLACFINIDLIKSTACKFVKQYK